MNIAFYDDPELLNNDPDGIDDPDFYKVENASIAINQGRLVSGSKIQTEYLENNGGRDYFGNEVSNILPPTIGAFNLNTTDDFELNIIVEESIVIYPNPTSNKINIEFGLLSNNDLVVKIWDVKGNLIYVKDNNNSSLCLDTSSLTKGLYQIEISDNSNLIKRKILIQ